LKINESWNVKKEFAEVSKKIIAFEEKNNQLLIW